MSATLQTGRVKKVTMLKHTDGALVELHTAQKTYTFYSKSFPSLENIDKSFEGSYLAVIDNRSFVVLDITDSLIAYLPDQARKDFEELPARDLFRRTYFLTKEAPQAENEYTSALKELAQRFMSY